MKKLFLLLLVLANVFSISAKDDSVQLEIVGSYDVLGMTYANVNPESSFTIYQPVQASVRGHFKLSENLNLFAGLNTILLSNSLNLGLSSPLYLSDNAFFNITLSGVAGREYINGIAIKSDKTFIGGEFGISFNYELFDRVMLIAGLDSGLVKQFNHEADNPVSDELAYKSAFFIGTGIRF